MDERDAVRRLIERLVGDSGLAQGPARDDLRRELESHFDEAGATPEARRAALERFGDAGEIGLGLRRAHRRGRLAWHVARIVASTAAAAAVAFVIQLAAGLWLLHGTDPGFAPGYLIAGVASLVIAVIAVAAWELGVEPLCARLERRPLHLLGTTVAFAAGIYVTHQVINHMVGPGQAAVLGVFLAVTWIAAVAILARVDLAFLRFLESH